VKFFTIELFQFKLGAISPVSVGQEAIKHYIMEVCEETVLYMLPYIIEGAQYTLSIIYGVTITTRMQLLEKNSSNAKGNSWITKVINSYTVQCAVKEGIIIGYLP